MNIDYYIGHKIIKNNQIRDFLEKTDKEFYPYLSCRVNIREYALKLYEKAILVIAVNKKNCLVGLTAFYANDFVTKKAYLSNINVIDKYNGLGIASTMMKTMEQFIIDKGFKELYLEVYSSNDRAINLYHKYGFLNYDNKNDNICMKKQYDVI